MNPGTGSVAIRTATQNDVDMLRKIYADAVLHGTASYEIDPPDTAEMGARLADVLAFGLPYLVAEHAGVVIGFAYASPFRARPAYRFSVEDSIYLAPEAQGRGFGRLLLEQLVEQVTPLGFRQLIAVIGDGNGQGQASVRLHEALGFRPAGMLAGSGYKFGRWLDTILMQRSLNGGTSTGPAADSLPESRFNHR